MMTKRIVLFQLIFLCTGLCFSQASGASEIGVFNEIKSDFLSGFYPGAVAATDRLEELYPDSVFINSARIYKAQSQLSMGLPSDSEKTLISVIGSIGGSEELTHCNYLLGIALYRQQKYSECLSPFHAVLSSLKESPGSQRYCQSLLHSARALFYIQDYSSASPLFEYAVANGSGFDQTDYEDALLKLFACYAAFERYEQMISLFEQLPENGLPPDTFSALSLYAADSYEKTGNTAKSYELYSGLKDLGSLFWIRFGIDFYGRGDFPRARSCFSYAGDALAGEERLLVDFYTARMQLLEDGKSVRTAERLYASLAAQEPVVQESGLAGLSDAYYSFLSYCRFICQDYAQAAALYKRVSSPDAEATYVGGAALYRTGDLAGAEEALSSSRTYENQLLYAWVLAKNKKYAQSEAVYRRYEGVLSSRNRLEFAKLLFVQKKYAEAALQAKKTEEPLTAYLLGLCAFQTSDYAAAYESLDSYLANAGPSSPYYEEASYYRSYSAYRNSNYQNAYRCAVSYADYAVNIQLRAKAYLIAARSAIMQGDFTRGALQAEKLIKAAPDSSTLYDAVILCAEIYTDAGNYSQAVKLLKPYTEEKSDFALAALTQTAVVYEKSGDVQRAAGVYDRIYSDYGGTAAAESALFRSSEIFYTAQEYETAESCFTRYLYAFPSGRFAASAYYFSGECNFRLKNYDRCIMQLRTLVSKFPEGIYSYGAYKNLMEAYYQNGHYADALACARHLIQAYNSQAVSDGISGRAVEIEKIINGTDRRIVEKETEFSRNGGLSEMAGRISGSELVRLYADYGSPEAAYELAVSLIGRQAQNGEFSYAADNAAFAATFDARSGKFHGSADYYLKAAEYYRSAGLSEQAAQSLYSAADAFVSAQLYADAQQTAELLRRLYPSSDYAARVGRLLD